MRVLAAALAAVVAATMAWSSAEAVDVQIDGFPFVCKSPEGEFLKPKFGDVDGIYFTGLPAARKPCLETIDRMIYSCTANTTFISHDLNNQYPDCLPTFERQAEQCVRHFEQERQKCYADDSSTPDQPAAEVVSSSRDDAGDVEIKGFSFGCTTPDGETRKPWYGGVDGTRFADLPSEREACLSLLSHKISSCRKNISFADHRQNRTFAACLPIFKGQVQDCVRHFEQERHKCYAGDSSAPAATTAEPKEPEVEPADLTMWAAKRSNIRSGPGTDHAKVGLLEVGDEVQVRGEIGDWLRITAPDGGDAFVYAPLLADADPVMDLDPKCQGFGKAKSCWLEITGRPNCYVWVSYLPDAFENVSWSGQCSGGFARGKGVLEVRYSDGHDMNIVGALSAGKFHGQIVFTYRDGKPFGGGFYVDGEQQFNIDVDQKPEISESTSAAATAATARALDIPDKATRVRVADRMKSCGNMRWSLIDYGGTFSTLNSEAKMRRFIKRVGRYGNSAVAMAKRYLDKCTPVSVRLLQSGPSCVVLERDRGISVELLDRIIRQPERYLDSNSQLNDTQRSTVTKYLRDCVQVYATAMDSGSVASIARAEDKPAEVATSAPATAQGSETTASGSSAVSDTGRVPAEGGAAAARIPVDATHCVKLHEVTETEPVWDGWEDYDGTIHTLIRFKVISRFYENTCAEPVVLRVRHFAKYKRSDRSYVYDLIYPGRYKSEYSETGYVLEVNNTDVSDVELRRSSHYHPPSEIAYCAEFVDTDITPEYLYIERYRLRDDGSEFGSYSGVVDHLRGQGIKVGPEMRAYYDAYFDSLEHSPCYAEVVREPPIDYEHFPPLDMYEVAWRMSLYVTFHTRGGGFEALSFDEESDFGGVTFHDVGGTDTHYISDLPKPSVGRN